MNKLHLIWLCLLTCTAGGSLAQSTNREKVIRLLLDGSHLRIHSASKFSPGKINEHASASSVLTHVDALPKYSLPKGNVVCRLEEYVQLHTPMKLNIGVGGQ